MSTDTTRITNKTTSINKELYTDTTHTSFFSCTVHVFDDVQSHLLAQERVCARHPIFMAIHDERLSVCWFCRRVFVLTFFVCFSFTLLFSSHFYLYSDLNLFFPCGKRQGKHTLRQLRSLAPWQNSLLPQVISPSSLTTSTTRRLLKSSSRRNPATKTRSLDLCDAELDDETIGKAPSSPLFNQERGESADRRQAYHSNEESLLPAQSFFALLECLMPQHGAS